MRKRYLLIGSIAFTLSLSKAQQVDTSSFQVDETEIEIIYNQYFQNGEHSAVTGGTGTERLIVYGPGISLKRQKGNNILGFNLGGDVISSASTDNIDFVVSSASLVDTRYHTDINYSRLFENKLTISGGVAVSVESDYFSFGQTVGVSKTSINDMSNLSLQLQIFFDDLRWGRLNSDYFKPVKLIYPEELRYKEWYDVYHRNSYNLNIGYNQIINSKNILGLYALLSLQEGLLATPFHRVYFTDGSLAVENLPKERYKGSLSLKWNSFLNGNIILRNSLSGYIDNFGIIGIWIDSEAVIKLSYRWSVIPNARIYSQQGSDYFAPYGEHSADEKYHSSDYDLSSFRSYKAGIGIRHRPLNRKNLESLSIRYSYYYRTEGLKANIISLILNYNFSPDRKMQ